LRWPVVRWRCASPTHRTRTACKPERVQLDPARFIRANRQTLPPAKSVDAFTAVRKDRLRVSVRPALAGEPFISRRGAVAFKAWVGG
jgi:hypothetical protein